MPDLSARRSPSCDHRDAVYRFAQMNVVGMVLTICDWLECPCGMVTSASQMRANWRPVPTLAPMMRPMDETRAPATVLTECLFCDAMIETRTGLRGVADMEAAGWEAVAGGDWGCPKCSESRADLIGEER